MRLFLGFSFFLRRWTTVYALSDTRRFMLSAVFFYCKGGGVERLGFRGEIVFLRIVCLFTHLIPHLRFPG